ncbi:hypothetical protein DWUX_2524 [Desulfovibrio diazotrophicus]|nr:hypothetical protein DWUX_2524 [Desulfovibrio diazotrophicus]
MSGKTAIVAVLLGLAAMSGYAAVLRGNIQTLEARLQACSTERDQALAAAAAGKAALDEQRKSVTGLQTALDACLAREQTAVATADQWREIIASAQSRDMAPEEKGKVPDATTRQLLQESLDLPL